ncbi:MAG: pitrilysin family protein [Candidatus Omnitrophica bacterium]|nr:pitrilysin family protein [Candidatus Omnitrophota bacterium]
MYKKTKLDNGLRIITNNMPGMRSAAVGIWINTGARYENPGYKGISHFLEHLTFKGSKKYSCRKIKESIEGVGGSLNGFTSEELTCYLVKLPSARLELAVDILSDMVINPLFPPAEIEREKTVILEEIKMYKDLPQNYVYDLLDELLWPGQPLGSPVIGSQDSVSRIKRQDICIYKKRAYTPLNIVVACAGDLKHGAFVKKVKKSFGGLGGQGINTFKQAEEEDLSPRLNLFTKDTEQTHLALGFHSFKRGHPLRHALNILHIIMGANMSSRLFNEVREKRGLAYEIGTQVKSFHDTGAFVVHAGIDNRKVNHAIEVILKEISKPRDTLVRDDEFRRSKEFYLGQLTLALEDTMDHMLWIGESTVTLDKTYSLENIVKEVSAVKREDVREVARYLFDDKKINLALIGPIEDKRQAIQVQLRLS